MYYAQLLLLKIGYSSFSIVILVAEFGPIYAISEARKDFEKPFFMEVMILALWNIWKQRNGQIFQCESETHFCKVEIQFHS
jgi:hypothetical protein